ncbi:MAG: NADH-quinone oxidoreductase subunit NuoF [Phycisphaerales bacterium]|nr:NADH-quinone oxidoreductase subunit NuoF [Phycisphaerales bacterium]
MPFEKVLMKNVGVPNSPSLKVYESRGGYEGARIALKMTPDALVELVKKANVRGRGGAGFPAGMKWSFLPKDRTVTYLCVNADESEPPTFCNRVTMEHDPHMLLEGILIAGWATRTTTAYIYMRGEFTEQYHIMQKAVDEAYAAGYFGRNVMGSGYAMDCYIHRGAGAYVCGEETGLIESLEGKRGWPRIKPPFPAIEGAFRKPTVVNNVETLACLPHILTRGVDWWLSIGPAGSHGPKMFCISGPVNRPGCYEAPLGVTVRELIYGDDFARGMRGDKKVKAVSPGGLSMGWLRGDLFPKCPDGQVDPVQDFDELDCRMDFDDVRRYGMLGLGTAALVVVNEDTDLRDVLLNQARFYAHESCGQCTQCREGTGWMYRIAERIHAGAGRKLDLDILCEVTANMGMMPGMSICGLPDGAVFPIRTLVQKFRREFEAAIDRQAPDAAAQRIRSVNPAAYELPIYEGRATRNIRGTMSSDHYSGSQR